MESSVLVIRGPFLTGLALFQVQEIMTITNEGGINKKTAWLENAHMQ